MKLKKQLLLVLLFLVVSITSMTALRAEDEETSDEETGETYSYDEDYEDGYSIISKELLETVERIEDGVGGPELFSVSEYKTAYMKSSNSANQTVYVYNNADKGKVLTYISAAAYYTYMLPVIDETSNMVEIMVSGVRGWIDKSYVNILMYTAAAKINNYQVTGGILYHYLYPNTENESGIAVIYNGPAPSFLNGNIKYYSFDGHYFYTNYELMIKDYQNKVHTNAVNPENPFYNYYQFLSYRSESTITAAMLDSYLASRGYTKFPTVTSTSQLAANESKLVGNSHNFVDMGAKYGLNPVLSFAIAINESGWGRSGIALQKNNLFGHGAVDSDPGEASGYESVKNSIHGHNVSFLNFGSGYMDPESGLYYGGYLGNKGSGINVKYASDPYWGEKAAALYYLVDGYFDRPDFQQINIGAVDLSQTSSLNYRLEPSTSSDKGMKGASRYFPIEINGQALWILESVKGESVNGNDIWYKVASDPILDTNREIYQTYMDPVRRETGYDRSYHYFYVHSSYVKIVSGSIQVEPKIMKGDLNEDGKITLGDLALLKAYLLGNVNLSERQLKAADINKDGKVTLGDLALVKAHLLGNYTITD